MTLNGQEITKDGETSQSARFLETFAPGRGLAAGPRESAREKE
jgi:hypothetical protein